MSLNIRSAVESDGPSVFTLAEQFATSFDVKREAFERSFKEVSASNDALLVVAVLKGNIVGYCLAFDHPAFFANGRVTWVEEIMVSEDCRLSGVGRSLMAAVERWGLARSSSMVALATRRAADFYSAIGFEESAIYFRKLVSSD